MRPDVVIVGLPTPTSSGAGITESLRADARTAGFLVLAITARVTERELAWARRAGAMKVLAMPIAPLAVLAEVEAALETV
jgi:DNA-binding response OmpR family regulator